LSQDIQFFPLIAQLCFVVVIKLVLYSNCIKWSHDTNITNIIETYTKDQCWKTLLP